MTILGIIAAYMAIVLIDLPSLLKTEQRKKTAIAYCFIVFFGFSMSIFQTVYENTFTPTKVIESIVKSIVG